MVVIDRGRLRLRGRPHEAAFLRTKPACQVWVTAAVVAAVMLPAPFADLGHDRTSGSASTTGLLLVVVSILNVEIARVLEGGIADTQRPHKGLSAWAFATALLLPPPWLLPVVAVTYGHAWWRGLRVTPWKWIGSAAYVVLAGLAAAAVADVVLGDERDLMHGDGLIGLTGVLAAAATFLVVESLLFHGSAYLNHATDEAWLRQTLASGSFYLTEMGVLLVGGLSAAIWTAGGWFILLLVPVYVLTQRAALHEPLRERAEHDDKTRTLRFDSWRRQSTAVAERCSHRGHPWSILFVDIDQFRAFNETWGHLVGDDALVVVSETMRAELRSCDLIARFGGEEFCVFLPEVALEHAGPIAERIRCAVELAQIPGATPVTISIGVAAVTAGAAPGPEFVAVLSAADRALYRSKNRGRNCSSVVTVEAE